MGANVQAEIFPMPSVFGGGFGHCFRMSLNVRALYVARCRNLYAGINHSVAALINYLVSDDIDRWKSACSRRFTHLIDVTKDKAVLF